MGLHARSANDLNPLSPGRKVVLDGCGITNVNQQGMHLRFGQDGERPALGEGDAVDVHMILQHDGRRKIFAIPSVVSHADGDSIDVEYRHTRPELLNLFEACRANDAEIIEVSVARSRQRPVVEESTASRAETSPALQPPAEPMPETSRRPLFRALTILLAGCMLAGMFLYVAAVDKRVNALDKQVAGQAGELADMRGTVFSSNLLEGRYALLNARVQSLADAFTKLERRITGRSPAVSKTRSAPAAAGNARTRAGPPPVTAASQGAISRQVNPPVPAPIPSRPRNVVVAEGEDGKAAATTISTGNSVVNLPSETPAAGGQERVPAVAKAVPAAGGEAGNWVINLLSSSRKLDADRLAARASARQIPAEIKRVVLRGNEYWRLQVPGFSSERQAKAYAETVKQQLGIRDVWIYKPAP